MPAKSAAQTAPDPSLTVGVDEELLSPKSFCRRVSVSWWTWSRWIDPPLDANGKQKFPPLPTVMRAGVRKTSIEAYHRWLKAQNP